MGRLVEAVAPARFGAGFRWLMGSSWTTNLGDGISVAAGPLLVASVTDDAFLISLGALLNWAPPLVFGLSAGVLADRLDRRRIMVVANVLRAAVLVAMAATVMAGAATAGTVLVALGVLGTVEVFADNTAATLLPMLVPRDDLAVANSRLQTGFITMNQLLGPAVGAALFAVGRSWPFATEAILVAAGALLVSRLRLPAHGRHPDRRTSLRRDVLDGLHWTVRHPAVRTLALTILIFNFTYGAAWSVLVLYADRRLGLGAVGFGMISTITAVGGLVGTGMYGWITRRVSLGNVMRIGLVIETFTHLALAVTTIPAVAAAIFFVFGAHAFIWGTTSVTIRQRAVPSEFQGRVGSLYVMCLYGGLVVGSAIGGTLASRFDVTAPFWFGFVGSAIFVVALWRQLTLIAHADREPATVAAGWRPRRRAGDTRPAARRISR